RVTLSDPEVLLEEGSDRMGLRMRVLVEPDAPPLLDGPPIGKQPPLRRDVFTGTLVVDGKLTYRPQEASFYYGDPTIKQLTFPHLPPGLETPVRNVAEALMAKHLQANPIYTMMDGDGKSRAAKSVLKSITVRDGKVVIEIG